MIPISFTEEERENLKKWYIDIIESEVIVKNIDKYYIDVENELKKFDINVKMKELLVMDHEELKKVQEKLIKSNQIYNQYNIPKKGRLQGAKYIVDNKILKKTYNFYKKIPKSKLINKIGINVCPYCNREFINNRINSTSAQIDHFLPRSIYPIFSISLFNLVPSCYTCNHIKRGQLLDISPYEHNLNCDSYYKFSYLIKGVDYLFNKDEIEVCINSTDKDKNNNNILKLDHAYSIHNDVVQEILKKKIVYSEGKIEELLYNFNDMFDSEEEIKRMLYGNYTEEDFCKRPLSKLISDILKEV